MRKNAITFFGCGLMRFAPGTWGTAGALLVAAVYYVICRAIMPDHVFNYMWNLGLIVGLLAACFFSVLWGNWAIAEFANHYNTKKPGDPGAFVLDEVAGIWLALLWLPVNEWKHAFWIGVVQFFAFRIADIIKPPPGRKLEKLHGGWGILLDDLSSAIYCLIAAHVVFTFLLGWK